MREGLHAIVKSKTTLLMMSIEPAEECPISAALEGYLVVGAGTLVLASRLR